MKRLIVLTLVGILVGVLSMSCSKETTREIIGPTEYDTTVIVEYDTTIVVDTIIVVIMHYDTIIVYDTVIVSILYPFLYPFPYDFNEAIWNFSHHVVEVAYSHITFDCYSSFTTYCDYTNSTPAGRDGFRISQIDASHFVAEGYARYNGSQYFHYGMYFTANYTNTTIKIDRVVGRSVSYMNGRSFTCW